MPDVRRPPTPSGFLDDVPGARLFTGVLEEIQQLVTRLHVGSKELFDDYDRLHGEAEFRMCLALPVTALSVSLGYRWSWFFLILLVLPPVLVAYALQKERSANDVVIEALCVSVLTSGSIQTNVRQINSAIAAYNVKNPADRLPELTYPPPTAASSTEGTTR